MAQSIFLITESSRIIVNRRNRFLMTEVYLTRSLQEIIS